MAGSDGSAETSTGKIETTATDGWHASVVLHGEIDQELAPRLRAELQRHLGAGRFFISIDVAGVSSLDSNALNALVTGAALCARAHGSMILMNVPPPVRRIIEISGLENVLLIQTAMDSA
jgi:anti-sigma B factor antagonist